MTPMTPRTAHGQQEVDERALNEQQRVDEIVRRGPNGAFAVAGVATAIVVAIYFVFYFVVYLPRGAVQ